MQCAQCDFKCGCTAPRRSWCASLVVWGCSWHGDKLGDPALKADPSHRKSARMLLRLFRTWLPLSQTAPRTVWVKDGLVRHAAQ